MSNRSIPALVASWPARAAAGWFGPNSGEVTGPVDEAFPWASVTKIITSMAIWVAVEEGTVDWDDEAGPPGATLAHLLAHASGLAPDGDQILTGPGRRRIYSNRGMELAAQHLAQRASMEFDEYVAEAVLAPLVLTGVRWEGSPASGASGTLTALLRIGRELLEPDLLAPGTVAHATTVAFPGLSGVLPGFGSQATNDWGLGVELRDSKRPHWTGLANSTRTFGHFGQSGAFLWVDPDRRVVAASVADRPFGPWAAEAWPAFSDAVLQEAG